MAELIKNTRSNYMVSKRLTSLNDTHRNSEEKEKLILSK